MMWFFAILLVLVMGGVAMVAAGRGAPLAEAYDDRPDALVPAAGDLVSTDLRRVRFSLALRGYRMSEVDALLDRLATQLGDPELSPASTAGSIAGSTAGSAAEPTAGPDRLDSREPVDADGATTTSRTSGDGASPE